MGLGVSPAAAARSCGTEGKAALGQLQSACPAAQEIVFDASVTQLWLASPARWAIVLSDAELSSEG